MAAVDGLTMAWERGKKDLAQDYFWFKYVLLSKKQT
jgi:hypothetical protein